MEMLYDYTFNYTIFFLNEYLQTERNARRFQLEDIEKELSEKHGPSCKVTFDYRAVFAPNPLRTRRIEDARLINVQIGQLLCASPYWESRSYPLAVTTKAEIKHPKEGQYILPSVTYNLIVIVLEDDPLYTGLTENIFNTIKEGLPITFTIICYGNQIGYDIGNSLF
jgi:hypothetical protein